MDFQGGIAIILVVFRYLFLLLFYLFIIFLVRLMFRELRYTGVASNRARANKDRGHGQTVPACLVVLKSPDSQLQSGVSFPLGKKTYLGRSKDNNLVIANPFVSNKHAVITEQENQYWLEDLDSLNGTYLNDLRLEQPAVLADGDRVRIGDVTFLFVRREFEIEAGI